MDPDRPIERPLRPVPSADDRLLAAGRRTAAEWDALRRFFVLASERFLEFAGECERECAAERRRSAVAEAPSRAADWTEQRPLFGAREYERPKAPAPASAAQPGTAAASSGSDVGGGGQMLLDTGAGTYPDVAGLDELAAEDRMRRKRDVAAAIADVGDRCGGLTRNERRFLHYTAERRGRIAAREDRRSLAAALAGALLERRELRGRT